MPDPGTPWRPGEREIREKLAWIGRCNLIDLQEYEAEAQRRTCEPKWFYGEKAAIAQRRKELGR